MDKHELIKRTRKFAVEVFKLSERFPRSQSAKVVTYQLLKSASSIAANYRAVAMAKSRADFAYKMKVVLEEADETNFWLEFAAEVELVNVNDSLHDQLVKESMELLAIFISSVKTINRHQ
jgi:four helix bundle protein